MKTGESVHIRVNAEDLMSCVDICKIAKIDMQGVSLAQIVKLALGGLLENARATNIIPRRDGFEYSEIVLPYLQNGRNALKLQINKVFENTEQARHNNDLPCSSMVLPQVRVDNDTPEIKRQKGKLLMRIMELESRKQNDIVNFTIDNQEELIQADIEYNNLITKNND